MQHRELGPGGLEVSVLGLGCSNFGRSVGLERAREIVRAAIDCGVTLLDTADSYGRYFARGVDGGDEGSSEAILGEVLGVDRDRVVLATKFGSPKFDMGFGADLGAKGSRTYIRRAVENSLRRLRTDRIDLYQMHFPDPQTPIEETLGALAELREEGKIRSYGHSNFSAAQTRAARRAAEAGGQPGFVSTQHPWSLLDRRAEQEEIPAAVREGVSVLAYFPLAQGLLTGKFHEGQPPPAGTRISVAPHLVRDGDLGRMESARAWAAQHGRTLLESALGWLLAQPGCAAVLPGAKTPEQVRANAEAVQRPLPEADCRDLAARVR